MLLAMCCRSDVLKYLMPLMIIDTAVNFKHLGNLPVLLQKQTVILTLFHAAFAAVIVHFCNILHICF